MDILILGAGAVGLSLAARLSKVADVHAVCRQKHADIIKTKGFKMTGIWGEETSFFSCGEDIPEDRKFDYIFISSKSTATRHICEQFADLIKDREVISLQNGIGNEEIIAEYTDRVIGGTIITGFEWTGDASVHVSVESGPMQLGRFPSGMDDSIQKLADTLKQAGVPVSTTDNIKGALWSKVLYNCALNPLGAIMGVPYGKLENPHAWSIIERLMHEAFMITAAEKIQLPWVNATEYLKYLKEYQLPNTRAHHSSMLQDLAARKRTEIEFLNGAVVQRAKAYSIDVPYNTFITAQIHFMEDLRTNGNKE
jgi:2-dehydropantoate 2-reductase